MQQRQGRHWVGGEQGPGWLRKVQVGPRRCVSGDRGAPAMEHGRRGDDDVRPVAAPQWSIIRLVSAGRLGRRPPNTKESPGRDLFVPTSPPRHYIPLIAHHLLTLSLADHLLCYIPSLTIESPLSRFPKTLAHHGQLSRAAQGHWHCKSFYPAKPLKCVELDGELQGATVVAILAGQTASRLAHMVVMALGHDANRALEIQVVVSDSGMLSLAPSPMFSETCC